jgi:tRNA uridine 5-carbamoylmethylation protein Kti12
LKRVKEFIDISVLIPVLQSKWGIPMFIILKKDDTVNFIMVYQKVNKMIKHKPYPTIL